MDPIQYGPSQLGEGNIQDGAHDHVAGINSAERAALRSVIESRGEKVNARKVREERDEHFAQQLNRINGNGLKINFPVATVQNEVNQGTGSKSIAAGTIPHVVVLISGVFKYCDLQGTVVGNV